MREGGGGGKSRGASDINSNENMEDDAEGDIMTLLTADQLFTAFRVTLRGVRGGTAFSRNPRSPPLSLYLQSYSKSVKPSHHALLPGMQKKKNPHICVFLNVLNLHSCFVGNLLARAAFGRLRGRDSAAFPNRFWSKSIKFGRTDSFLPLLPDEGLGR